MRPSTVSPLVRQMQNEFNAMTNDFVLPSYEAFPKGCDIDPNLKHGQTQYREKKCFDKQGLFDHGRG